MPEEGRGRFTAIGTTYGIGVVGLGEGKGLVKGLADHPELKVVSICDRNGALARSVAEQFGVPHYDTAMEDLLKRDGIDIVAIYTPDQLHFTCAITAAAC